MEKRHYTFTKSQCKQLTNFFDDYGKYVTGQEEKELVEKLKRTFDKASPSASWEVSNFVSLEFTDPKRRELVDFAIDCLYGSIE